MQTKKIIFTAVLITASFLGVLPLYSQSSPLKKIKQTSYVIRPVNENDLVGLIHRVAVNWGLEPRLFENLLRKESGGTCRFSPKGARGIAQLMPDTARRLGLRVDNQIDERCDLIKSLNAGARYLRYQFDLFKDVRLALAGYNAGEGAVMNFGYRIPPYKETTQYVETILAWTYGRTGMSLEKAYNYNTALKYIAGIYRNRQLLVPALNTPVNQIPANPLPLQETSANLTPPLEKAELKSDSVEKPNETRKVVRVTDLEPRLATSSLFFNKKE